MTKVKTKLKKIINFLIKTLDPDRIILFGSRAKDLEKPFSDIDLAIDVEKEISFREFRKIKENLEKLSGIYSVDIVFFKKIDTKFKSIILQTGKVIYEKSRSSFSN